MILARLALAPLVLLTAAGAARAGDDDDVPGVKKLYMESAQVNGDGTVTLPLHEGRSGGRTVWYVVTEASDGDLADAYGVADADKLENALGTAAVQRGGRERGGVLTFPATVDFRPERIVVGDPETGFPPLQAVPGSVGEEGYSPLVELPGGGVLNAPHVANGSGLHDAVKEIDFAGRTVTFELIDGFARKKPVQYLTFDASGETAAALEGVTFAPALNAAPFAGGDGSNSSRAALAAMTNGPTGVDNPQRQGLNSALLGEGPPRNILAWLPNQGRYSPLWDVHLSTFTGEPALRTRFADVEDGAEDDGEFTNPDGGAWGPSDFLVNCPVVLLLDD